MARAPSGTISKTTGQGISRGAYQTSRQLRLGGSGASQQTKPMPILRSTPGTGGGGVASGTREYSKSASGPVSAEYTNREMANPNLKELNTSFGGKPKAGKGFVL